MDWQQKLRHVMSGYAEPLLRHVARKLLKPRTQLAPGELKEKIQDAVQNAVLVDRRLKDLSEQGRSVLAILALSRQPIWRLGGVLELLSCIAGPSGFEPVFELFQAGLLYPERPPDAPPLDTFEAWLATGGESNYHVWAMPFVCSRALALGLPDFEPLTDILTDALATPQEEDGWEIPLRLSYLWQQVRQTPLRITAQGEFYKRDGERLQDAILCAPLSNTHQALPQLGHALVLLGEQLGFFLRQEGEITAGHWPAPHKDADFHSLLGFFWSLQSNVNSWTAHDGWRGWNAQPTPLCSAAVLTVGVLAKLQPREWAATDSIAEWLAVHHAYWQNTAHPPDLAEWVDRHLCGWIAAFKLTQVAVLNGKRYVRLSPTGRIVLGLGDEAAVPSFPRTLLVQPNLEVLVYRQGLTPLLLWELSCCAKWKSVGAACTLLIDPETVYHGMEGGVSVDHLVQLLQRHSVREVPPNVLNALRTWSDKRDRITVYTSAQLLEFKNEEEAERALATGLNAVRLSPNCLAVAREEDLEYRHFRLLGSRDYHQAPGVCIEVGEDGVTLIVDEARADLLLLSELDNYADRLADLPQTGQRRFNLSTAKLGALNGANSALRHLEDWFEQRTGIPLTPAARLLLAGKDASMLNIQPMIVLHTPTVMMADGLIQWPETRRFISSRLGPQALAIEESSLAGLEQVLQSLGLRTQSSATRIEQVLPSDLG